MWVFFLISIEYYNLLMLWFTVIYLLFLEWSITNFTNMTLKFKTEELVPCIKNLFCWSKNWFIDFKDNTRLLQKMYLITFLVIIMYIIMYLMSMIYECMLMCLYWLGKHTHPLHYFLLSKKTEFRIFVDTPLEILVGKS